MLLTLSQSGKPEFGVRPPHELASPPPHSALRYSPHRPLDHVLGGGPPNNYAMSTQHRGLPPPSAMTLPEPRQQQPPPPPPPPHQSGTIPSQPQLGALPAPPSQWQGGEDSMRHWLSTKAEEERTKQEEEKRRQEEERTRQEHLKLQQREVEQSILRESMKGGIPPQMIPVIFAGIGGHSLVSASVEMLQHYAAQLHATQQQQQQQQQQVHTVMETSPEQARETRMVNPPVPNPFAAPQQPAAAQTQPAAPLSQHQTTFSAYNTAPRGGPAGPTSAPRSVPASGLSRINTIDIAQPGPSQGGQHGQSEQAASSPSIYFHHWVPPATQDTKGHQPPTPIGRNEPSSAHPSAGESEYKDSPRKRKAIGGHGPLPPPSQTSPSFSSQSSTRSRGNSAGHMRSRSNKSNEDQSEASRRPPSRRDSVATQPRAAHEHNYGHDPHSRTPSHTGIRSPPTRRDYMR